MGVIAGVDPVDLDQVPMAWESIEAFCYPFVLGQGLQC